MTGTMVDRFYKAAASLRPQTTTPGLTGLIADSVITGFHQFTDKATGSPASTLWEQLTKIALSVGGESYKS
ncbi:MAG TPA: hypothetical protein VFT87_00335 [Candidatus Saccharimonadales bacterium]|nr:hypothetical protein [Candidatus Saccharimonadales bacterium]